MNHLMNIYWSLYKIICSFILPIVDMIETYKLDSAIRFVEQPKFIQTIIYLKSYRKYAVLLNLFTIKKHS